MPADATEASAACLNCRALLAVPKPRYCGQCGQETRLKPPTLMQFAQQFGGAYLSTEGALWRTLALLLARPGELTRRYLGGQRKHYVLPLRLYLSISVIVLLLLRATANFNVDLDGSGSAVNIKAPGEFTIDAGFARAGIKGGNFYCEGFPPTICKRLQRRMDLDPKNLEREAQAFADRLVGNAGGALFALLPLFALWLKLVYFKRRMAYTEHLVFALHLHAFWFIALTLAVQGWPWISAAAGAAVPLYALLAARRVYGGRWWPLVLRAALVSLLYLFSFGLVMIGLALVALLF
jgi:Protein of unknown function (DUF3667)